MSLLPRRIVVFSALLAAIVLAATLAAVEAAGTKKPKDDPGTDPVAKLYAEGEGLVWAGKYDEALAVFEKAHKKDKKNPDVVNMLAYTQRKTGDLDSAFENYARALELKPRFPEAREYLGEAHIDAVLREIETLRGYGAEGQKELAELIQALKKAAEGL